MSWLRIAFVTSLITGANIGSVSQVNAEEERIRPEYWGCLTEEALDQFIRFIVREDMMGVLSMEGYCFMIGGLRFSLLDSGWSKAQVRVYDQGTFLDLWTVIEALP